KADFSWTVSGGVVNFDLHGDGGGRELSYQKGRAVSTDEGTITAAFDGNHGWFWRNRGADDVTVTLKTTGSYAEIKRMI
ncbi:MAG: transmembrane anchor protein, partial [Bosea sp. 12-68-7]